MIAIVAIRPNIIWVDHIFFSHEEKDSIFISRQQWNNVTENIRLLLLFNHFLKKYSQKEKQVQLFL
jgi:hypothetical protein